MREKLELNFSFFFDNLKSKEDRYLFSSSRKLSKCDPFFCLQVGIELYSQALSILGSDLRKNSLAHNILTCFSLFP